MNKVIVRAPVRADLAGGTLDMWPLYLFHPGSRTVNVAISYYAESEVSRTADDAIEIHLTDQQYRQRYESLGEMSGDPKAALIFRIVEHFHLSGIRITTRTDAPRGSGLGGSSALSVTLVRALSELAGAPVEGENLIALVRDLETRLLGVPAGIQDYYPPVYGGLAALHLLPGAPVRRPINVSVSDLAAHMLLHYTGVAHFSGTNNWEMYKRQIDGKKKVQRGLGRIAANSAEMEKALQAGNFQQAGKVLANEWKARKALIAGISTSEIDAAIDAALAAGAWGGKVCGAGGGGCIVFLFPPDRREAVQEALSRVPGRVLDVAPVAHGMTIHRGDEAQSNSTPSRSRLPAPSAGEPIEQMYAHQGGGDYRPYLYAEAIVTHSEPRSGTHVQVTRSFMTPLLADESQVSWSAAHPVQAEQLDMRTTPDPSRRIDRALSEEALRQSAARGVETFSQFLEESERLRLFQNPNFNLFSEAGESRDAFLIRCMDEANRRVSEHAERLESTFRRRIDQLREKSEREDREREEGESPLRDSEGVNVAWGQALYNITSGRPAAVSDSPQSVREVDYLENIAQIQRAWDRELEALRDDLTAKASEITEITVAPGPRNIEVSKYLIVWAGNR